MAEGRHQGGVISFDETAYRELIKFLGVFGHDLKTDFLRADRQMSLNSSLGKAIKPGATTWGLVGDIQTNGGTFGESVRTNFNQVSHDTKDFGDKLTDGLDIFTTHSNLAAVDASTIIDEYPEFGTA